MKSNTKKRLIAFMLCMVLVLSSTISAFADEPQNTDSQSQAEVVTEPTADEPQNTDSQSQAEVVTEPAADEATEDTTTEDVSTENTITEDVSDTPDIEIPSKKEWSVQVGNATVKVNGSADALPADAQLSVTEITSEDEVKEIEKAVEEKAIEEQFSIKNIFSYDIKFLVNGSEVQPTTPVQVSVDTPEIVSNENTAVLHVDDNNVAEDMNGAVDGEGKVVFDAPHFSKYVIVQKGKSKVNVTIEYYDDTQTPKAMIYASKKELSPGESISNYDIADNWNINWAEKSTTDGKFESISNLDEIQVVSDCIIRVYYTPQEKTLAGSTTFYDYTVKAGKQDGSWGFSDTYYSFNQLTNDKSPKVSENKKLIAGTNDSNVGQNYPEYQQYKISLPDSNGNTKDANCYTGGDSTIPGLLKEIDDNGNVIFNYAEPGFFVDSDYSVQFGGSIFGGSEKRFLRKVYKDYTLEFARKGDTYTLNGVRNKDNGWVTGAGNNFYPLNSVKPSYEDSERGNNNYFGMRYDVTFKIGDYVGPLNYKFTGDDDLWVVLDGKKIVIDLGGIHSAATGNVDLWQYIGDKENLTEAQKQQTHTLTILYMERGAGASNCQMEFTLPSAKIQQVDKTKMTNISFYKTDADGTGLSGAQFTLTNDSTKTTMYAASESDGLVQFQQLVAGTYTLTETQAPKDYVTPTTSWKVKVTADGNNGLSTKIYQADGTTELGKLTGGEYQIINSASTPVQPPTPGIVETKKELSHEKYIAKNEDGTYNLTLNVSGAVGSESYANKLDVLFVMDTSNSMKRGMDSSRDQNNYTTNSSSRFYNQQKAVEDAVAKLKNKKNVDAQFAVVAFDTQAGIKTDWTKGSITYPTRVGNYSGYNKKAGGTNYEAGLIKAKELLDSGRTDATKIVVFLSDGDPTFYYKKNSQGNITGIGGGDGNSYSDTAMANAQTQLSKMSMNYFYTVGVGPEDSYNHLSSLISNAPSGTVTGSYNGTDSSNLKNAFDTIIRDATELLCTDVTVTDTWKLEDCLDGTYKVSESNYGKDGYDVTVTVNGQQVTNWNDFSVSTKQATIEEYKQSENTTTCSPKTFSIGKVNLIVAKLTANEGYFVWTNTPVSISERKEIVKLINDKIDGIKGIGFSPEAELQKCYFYSGNGIKDTLVFRNGEIKYDGQDVLTFDASKQWSMFAAGTYTFTEPQNAEIQITNTYSEQTADLDLIKTSVTGTKFDGAEFKLYKKNDEGAYELQKFEYTDESGKNQTRETIQVINTEGSKAELKNLQSGQYYLEEVKAPEACMLLADKIYFKQEKGKITLTDKEGKALSSEPTMWTLSNTAGKYTLTVKNEILYSLPSAGGTGIYLYMIGGILLMFAAVWILYKNKCKEVLEK